MADATLEPISLADAKLNLRVSGASEDTRIQSLIVAAREHVENYTGLVLTPREVAESSRSLGRWLDLNAWPIANLDGIALSYLDAAGVEQDIPNTAWRANLRSRPVRLLPLQQGWGISSSWATSMPVTIVIQAGFPTPDDVPEAVKQAMHLLIAHFYANRSAVVSDARSPSAAVSIPFGVEPLLRRWRKRSI